jgi:hypothetical protein
VNFGHRLGGECGLFGLKTMKKNSYRKKCKKNVKINSWIPKKIWKYLDKNGNLIFSGI